MKVTCRKCGTARAPLRVFKVDGVKYYYCEDCLKKMAVEELKHRKEQ